MKKRDGFKNSFGFVLACIGSAVGMGNIWLFPRRVAAFGAPFLIAYLICVVVIGFSGVIGEMAFGRAMRAGPMGAFEGAMERRSCRGAGTVLSMVPVLGSFAMAIGYSVVVGWIIRYTVGTFTGATLASEAVDGFWGAFGMAATGTNNLGFHLAALIISFLILVFGVSKGIENSNKIFMPVFFALFIAIAIYVSTLNGAADGYRYMFQISDWSQLLSGNMWKYALGQAFFSLSVTGSGMIVYGAYLSKDEDVVSVSRHTALFDTIAAMVAALVIIPACFSYGLDVGAGPSLLFVTLPTILQDIPMGQLFAIILYVAMIFAGVSSLQNMFEAVAESLMHKFPKLSRSAVLVILCVLCLGFGIGMETIDKWGPWMDLVSIYIIPIGATLGAISWFYVMKKDELLSAINTGSSRTRGIGWYRVGRYVYVPLAVILCCVALFMKVAF